MASQGFFFFISLPLVPFSLTCREVIPQPVGQLIEGRAFGLILARERCPCWMPEQNNLIMLYLEKHAIASSWKTYSLLDQAERNIYKFILKNFKLFSPCFQSQSSVLCTHVHTYTPVFLGKESFQQAFKTSHFETYSEISLWNGQIALTHSG